MCVASFTLVWHYAAMKRFFVYLSLTSFIIFMANMSVFAASSPLRPDVPEWQKNGERLTYDIRFLSLRAGEAEIYFKPDATTNSYAVVGRAWTNGLSSFVFIRDRLSVRGKLFGTIAFEPEEVELVLNDNDYRAHKLVRYSHTDNKVSYHNRRNPQPAKSYVVADDVRDVFSALYYLRDTVKNPAVGAVFTLPVWDLDQGYTLQLKVLGKTTENTVFGKRELLELQPVLKANNTGKIKDKWRFKVTNDTLFVPVEIDVQLPVGSFVAKLSRYAVATSPSAAPEELPQDGFFDVDVLSKQRSNAVANPVAD